VNSGSDVLGESFACDRVAVLARREAGASTDGVTVYAEQEFDRAGSRGGLEIEIGAG
jgi:hypothetical protein